MRQLHVKTMIFKAKLIDMDLYTGIYGTSQGAKIKDDCQQNIATCFVHGGTAQSSLRHQLKSLLLLTLSFGCWLSRSLSRNTYLKILEVLVYTFSILICFQCVVSCLCVHKGDESIKNLCILPSTHLLKFKSNIYRYFLFVRLVSVQMLRNKGHITQRVMLLEYFRMSSQLTMVSRQNRSFPLRCFISLCFPPRISCVELY